MRSGARPRCKASARRRARVVVLAAPALASIKTTFFCAVWMATCSSVGVMRLGMNCGALSVLKGILK